MEDWKVEMKNIWKPIVLIFVIGVMAVDIFLDIRAKDLNESQVSSLPFNSDLPEGILVGDRAPNFTGTTLDGQTLSLYEFHGKTVLINVFASWCAPCRLEMPHLVDIFNNQSTGEMVFIGLNLQETPDAVMAFRDDFEITFPLVLNQDGRLTEVYTPIGLPTSWFIDPDGVIRYVHAGPMTAELVQGALAATKAGRQYDPFEVSD